MVRISIKSTEKEEDTERYLPLFGDPLEIRTPDPLLKRQFLKHSYQEKFGFIKKKHKNGTKTKENKRKKKMLKFQKLANY